MTNRYYTLVMRSNNTDIDIMDRLEVADLSAAINAAKATLATVKAIPGIPTDIRIKLVQFTGDVPVVEPPV